jgi:hypothetical protein
MVHVSREVVRRSARTLANDELQGYDATEDMGMPCLRRVLDAPLQHFGEDYHCSTGARTERGRAACGASETRPTASRRPTRQCSPSRPFIQAMVTVLSILKYSCE